MVALDDFEKALICAGFNCLAAADWGSNKRQSRKPPHPAPQGGIPLSSEDQLIAKRRTPSSAIALAVDA
ncbi:hypothetical protein, partial [Ralstonia pseudosolanacearum]|uniref:hypothetical protein n=1 Tax=Ralstonia pseudosolanacearum TaxID=1310165 RepID=UPI001FFAFC79